MSSAVVVPRRARVLGCPVDVVDMESAVERVVDLVNGFRSGAISTPGVVVTLNPEMVEHSRRSPAFAAVVEQAALVIPDGIGIVMALHRRGYRDAIRVSGADFVDACFERARVLGYRIALVGAAPGIAARAADAYRQRHDGLNIVFADSGEPTLRTVEKLTQAKPDFVAAAFGHGRQERFLADHLTAIGAACGVGVGGTLDYVAGRVRRAPQLVQRANLEWAWRLAREPRRLRRQLALPAFWWHERGEVRRHA